MAEPISIQQLKDASEDAITLADFIYKPANVMIPRRLAADINSLQYYLDYMSSYAQHSYETYDEMVANAPNLSENVSVFVTNDLDTSKNGIYTYNGTSFVKGDYQPENLAKDFVEAKLDGLPPFEGGVLADTFVTVTSIGEGKIIRNQKSKNGEVVTPYDFGAVGNSSLATIRDWTVLGHTNYFKDLSEIQAVYPHAVSLEDTIDWVALQAFFNYCENNYVVTANCTIKASVNRPITYTNENQKTKLFDGDLTLISVAPMDTLLSLRGVGLRFSGEIYLKGMTDSSKKGFARKLNLYGLRIAGEEGTLNSGERTYIRSIVADNFAVFGVVLAQYSMFAQVDFLRGTKCGSGFFYDHDTESATTAQITSFSERIDTNSTPSISQLTQIKVAALPLHEVIGNLNIFIGRKIYTVKSVDYVNSTLSVYPNIDTDITEGKLVYNYGGAVNVTGNGSGMTRFGTIQSILCGSGYSGSALFGSTVQTLVTEFCGVGVIINNVLGSGTMGYYFTNSYFEANILDYVQVWNSLFNMVNFAMTEGLKLPKIVNLQRFKNYNTLYPMAGDTLTEGSSIAYRNEVYTPSSFTINFTGILKLNTSSRKNNQIVISSDKGILDLSIDPEVERLFGESFCSVVFLGSKANSAPSGVLEVIAPVGYTVNGSSRISFSCFNEAATITIKNPRGGVLKDLSISCTAARSSKSTPTLGLFTKGQYIGNEATSNTFDAWLANNTGFACGKEWTTSSELKNDYYFAGTKVYYVHTTGMSPDVLVTSMEKGVIKTIVDSTLTYEYMGELATFKEISYTVETTLNTSGSTENRPISPEVGLTYFDTTLGKPIYYSGSAWVDATGVVV